MPLWRSLGNLSKRNKIIKVYRAREGKQSAIDFFCQKEI